MAMHIDFQLTEFLMMELSQDIVSPSEFICSWIFHDEGIHIWWDEGQIMKVIDLKKQPKNSRSYSMV